MTQREDQGLGPLLKLVRKIVAKERPSLRDWKRAKPPVVDGELTQEAK